MRVVFDTVVFVRALINPANACGRLLSEFSERYTLVVSKPTAQELLEVLHRPELRRKYRRLAALDTRRVVDLLAQAEAVEIEEVPRVVRDVKDDIFVATALAGRADYLVSEDNDLLALRDGAGVPIVNVREFLRILEKGESQDRRAKTRV